MILNIRRPSNSQSVKFLESARLHCSEEVEPIVVISGSEIAVINISLKNGGRAGALGECAELVNQSLAVSALRGIWPEMTPPVFARYRAILPPVRCEKKSALLFADRPIGEIEVPSDPSLFEALINDVLQSDHLFLK